MSILLEELCVLADDVYITYMYDSLTWEMKKNYDSERYLASLARACYKPNERF